MAMVVAMEMYQGDSSSVLCSPGGIQGTLSMKASTISTDLCLRITTLCARFFAWVDSLFDRAACWGLKRAEAAMMEVQRKAEREEVKGRV